MHAFVIGGGLNPAKSVKAFTFLLKMYFEKEMKKVIEFNPHYITVLIKCR